jgi:hypothetical protein
MGGTLFHLTPYAVSALAGLHERLPHMAQYAAWARSLAAELTRRGVRVNPDPPQTNTFQVFADGEPDEILERKIAFMEKELVEPCGGWWPSRVPGIAMTEVAVHEVALTHEPARVADWIAAIAAA